MEIYVDLILVMAIAQLGIVVNNNQNPLVQTLG